jgi:hypothetical protein
MPPSLIVPKIGEPQIFGVLLTVLIACGALLFHYISARRANRRSNPWTDRIASDGRAARPGYENASAPAPIDPATGQHEAYWVLSPSDRAKGFVRPVRTEYWHLRCKKITGMTPDIAETFARNPSFYGRTMCVHCGEHFPVGRNGEFLWVDDNEITNEKVGT